MSVMKDILNEYVRSKSKFFNLGDGEEVEVRFISVEKVPNHFDGGKTDCLRYHFEVNGQELLWDRISRELAIQMQEVQLGQTIRIKRIGQKSKTKYFITKEQK